MKIPERFEKLCSLFNQLSSNEVFEDEKKYEEWIKNMEGELHKLEHRYQKIEEESVKRKFIIAKAVNELFKVGKIIKGIQSELENDED